MKCVICKKGETKPGRTTVTLERGCMIMVIRGVPAQICNICGEAYTDEKTTANLLKSAEDAIRAGAQVEIRDYVEAR